MPLSYRDPESASAPIKVLPLIRKDLVVSMLGIDLLVEYNGSFKMVYSSASLCLALTNAMVYVYGFLLTN